MRTSVKKISKAFLDHVLYKTKLKKENLEKFKILQLQMIIKIQSYFRMYYNRKHFKKLLKAAKIIVNAGKKYFINKLNKLYRIAAKFNRRLIMRKYLYKIKLYNIVTYESLMDRAEKLQPKLAKRLAKRTLTKIKILDAETKELTFDRKAEVLWEGHIKIHIINCWKTVLGETITKNLKLNKIFINCISLKSCNSFHQKANIERAELFLHRRLILPAWAAFCDDYLRALRAAKKMPMSIEHYRINFFNRVVAATYDALVKYLTYRKWRHLLKRKADIQLRLFKLKKGYKKLLKKYKRKLYDRNQFVKSLIYKNNYDKKKALLLFPFTVKLRQYTLKSNKCVDLFWKEFRNYLYWERYKLNIVEMSKLRRMNEIAIIVYNKKLIKKKYIGWTKFTNFSKNIIQFVRNRYNERLKRKAMYGLKFEVTTIKAEKARMMKEIQDKCKDEENLNKLIKALIKLQSKFRGIKCRKIEIDRKTTKLFSIRIIQNTIRCGLAKLKVRRLKRLLILDIAKKEEQELELMRIAETETLYYEYHMKAATNIQRIFRGFHDRELTSVLAIERTKERGKGFYAESALIRSRHENFLKAEEARKKQRNIAVSKIQARVRGMLQRKKYAEMKHQAKVAKYVFACQKWYRGKLGRMRLAALRRDKVGELRFKAARRQRGVLLRLFGFMKRKTQNYIADFLKNAGIDPISFNYRFNELFDEVKNDYNQFIEICKREYDLMKEFKGNRILMASTRRKILNALGWSLRVNDSVRIVDEEHQFYGYTGVVVRIDTEVPGLPLYEVKLDHFLKKQTFAMMTTDALVAYERQQILAKIEKFPKLIGFEQPFVLFGIDPEDPLFTEKSVNAVWTIQRAFRCYRARNIVARKRYESWTRTAHCQYALFSQLADLNTVTAQAYNISGFIGLKFNRRIFFDALRHPAVPVRLLTNATSISEVNAIRDEFNIKYGQRIHYLERCAITQDKDPFWLGYERMTTFRKMKLCRRVLWGFIKNGGRNIKDLIGKKGAKFLSNQQSMVTGTDNYKFSQFQGSPHVRYSKTIIYQGEWSGIPLFTPIIPHGKGFILFLDGWGFAREDKVLYLTIVRLRRLMAMDVVSSDPYCDIYCNAKNLQTSVKYGNLNPEFHESFEIDVTNPSAVLKIIVKDYDFLTADDFMGKIELKLSKYADGNEHRETFTLCDQFGMVEDDNDRGDIELVIRWANRIYTDDMQKHQRELMAIIRIQSFVRRIFAKIILRNLNIEKKELIKMALNKCVMITSAMRRRLAYKIVKKLRRRLRACIKIQKRMRIFLAKKKVKYYRLRHNNAIIIQKLMRKVLAKKILEKLKLERLIKLNNAATLIQSGGRRLIARCKEYIRKLQAIQQATTLEIQTGTKVIPPLISSWINTYGRDPIYGLKRTRRIYETTFAKMLKKKYSRISTRLGHMFIDQYPPQDLDKVDGEDLRKGDEFVAVFVSIIQPRFLHLKQAIETIQKFPHNAIIHIPSSVSVKGTVDLLITQIQCAIRCWFANKAYKQILKIRTAIIKLQRIFRRRFEKLHRASLFISGFIRSILAKKKTSKQRIEINSVKKIQSAVRIWIAKCRLFDKRCIRRVTVLRASSEILLHGPEKLLDFKSHTFWLANSTEIAECRFELKRRQAVEEIWIMTCTRQASPQLVTIEVVNDKRTMKYDILYSDIKLLELPGYQWRKFSFPATVAKFFKLTFRYNYGDLEHIGVRQVRFVRAKEKSVKITKEPEHYIFINDGPIIGKNQRIILNVETEAWPLPTYQWYRNGNKIIGATKPQLILNVKCELSNTLRTYRCTKCKMVSLEVPDNCFHIICGNCSHLFNYKDSEIYDNIIKDIHEKESVELKELEAYFTSLNEMETSKDLRLRAMITTLKEKIKEQEDKLQILKERRNTIKDGLEFVNIYNDEGLYVCVIENIRGGELIMKVRTRPTVVFVEHSERYRVKVKPLYNRRQVVLRKKWTIYSSIVGNFNRGKLVGIVLIRYNDGSFYEGPYISEEWLDSIGRVNEEGRALNHYGVYTCADGRIFEGRNIDNHFDPYNLQSFYRCKLQNGEIYEGIFTDEMFHGIGMYLYKDGSVYEGNFHKGMRFGHGLYRSSESEGSWTYEGEWDTNRKHGEGMISWPDGSFYIGEWYYDKRKGKGIYVSRLRDVYKGEFDNDCFHGCGELLYSDGSKFNGNFINGKRQGRGILAERNGRELYGNFHEDKLHGEAIIKNIVPIEMIGQDNYEVRIALYSNGEFIEWKSKYSNPTATRQFIKLFKENRAMFDSVYSMIVAKSLPEVPHGLDDRNEDVRLILEKIRTEAGMLVGQEILEKAHQRLSDLMAPLKQVKEDVIALKEELDTLSVQTVNNEQIKNEMLREYKRLMTDVEHETLKIEQYWYDDPTESRGKFLDASKKLSKVSKDEYFFFKNHRKPPPFVRKVLDAICILLNKDINNWKIQQMIVSDAIYNARFQDDDALRYDYHCKLDHILNSKQSTFDIFDYVGVFDSPLYPHLQNILTDPRMRADSYYIESCGVAAPVLVNWIEAMYRYVKCAKSVFTLLEQARKNKVLASRISTDRKKKEDEQVSILARIKVAREDYNKKLLELQDLEEAILKAEDMIKFVKDSYNFGKKRTIILDYYEVLEKKLEEQKDQLDIASCIETMIKITEDRAEETRKEKVKEYRARGEVYVPPIINIPIIMNLINEEVTFQQNALISDNQSIGYSIEVSENTVSIDLTKKIIKEIVNMLVGTMNTCYHEFITTRLWIMNNGKKITQRFLYIMVWKAWKDIATNREETKAINGWEEIFGPDYLQCAKMAIQARVNWRMSEVAKYQSKIWAKKHKFEIEKAESILSEEFETEYTYQTAEEALRISEDESGVSGPELKASAVCWIKLHPERFNSVKDERASKMAKNFSTTFPQNTGTMAFKIMNGLLGPGSPEYEKYDEAEQWIAYNRIEYEKDVATVSVNLAKKFVEKYPLKTAMNAVTIIQKEDVSKYITDPEVMKEYSQAPDEYFSARCWGLLNQGLIRGALEIYMKEQKSILNRAWSELEHLTEKFVKGSYLYTSEEYKMDPTLDRFAGFRDRLSNKFGYIYGYLGKRAYDLFHTIEGLQDNDPLTKISHNIRPSRANKIEDKLIDEHIEKAKVINEEYEDITNKLSIWHTYFGTDEEKKYYISYVEYINNLNSRK